LERASDDDDAQTRGVTQAWRQRHGPDSLSNFIHIAVGQSRWQ